VSGRILWALLGKMAVATAVMTWLLSRADVTLVWRSLSEARVGPIAAGMILGVVIILLAAWRWQKLLAVFALRPRLRSLFAIAWIGQFFMMFLPGPVGDDLTRMLYVSKLSGNRVAAACTSVLLDRLIGLSSVFVLCLFCVPFQWRALSLQSQTAYLAGIVIIGGLGCVALWTLYLAVPDAPRRLGAWLGRMMPPRWKQEVDRLGPALGAHRPTMAVVFTAALAIQLLNCVSCLLAGWAVGIHLSFWSWASFVPILLAANVLPITVAGIGVRDYLFVLFLGALGAVPDAQALAASVIMLGMMMAVSFAGGLVYIIARPTRHEDAPDHASRPPSEVPASAGEI